MNADERCQRYLAGLLDPARCEAFERELAASPALLDALAARALAEVCLQEALQGVPSPPPPRRRSSPMKWIVAAVALLALGAIPLYTLLPAPTMAVDLASLTGLDDGRPLTVEWRAPGTDAWTPVPPAPVQVAPGPLELRLTRPGYAPRLHVLEAGIVPPEESRARLFALLSDGAWQPETWMLEACTLAAELIEAGAWQRAREALLPVVAADPEFRDAGAQLDRVEAELERLERELERLRKLEEQLLQAFHQAEDALARGSRDEARQALAQVFALGSAPGLAASPAGAELLERAVRLQQELERFAEDWPGVVCVHAPPLLGEALVEADGITLRWSANERNDNVDITEYHIFRAADLTDPAALDAFVEVDSIEPGGATALTWKDTEVEPGVSYIYYVVSHAVPGVRAVSSEAGFRFEEKDYAQSSARTPPLVLPGR